MQLTPLSVSSPRLCPTRMNFCRPCLALQAFKLSKKKSSALPRSEAVNAGRPDKPCRQTGTQAHVCMQVARRRLHMGV